MIITGTPENVCKALSTLRSRIAELKTRPEFMDSNCFPAQQSSRIGEDQTEHKEWNNNDHRLADDGMSFKGKGIPAPGRRKTTEPGRLVEARQGSNPDALQLCFENSQQFSIPKKWLRDCCPCDLCIDPSTGRKTKSSRDVNNLDINPPTILPNGSLQITWIGDHVDGSARHTSTYPLGTLYHALWNRRESNNLIWVPGGREIWDAQHFLKDAESRKLSYNAWMAGGPEFVEAFTNLLRWGLIVLKAVPASDRAVLAIAGQVGRQVPFSYFNEADNPAHALSSCFRQDLYGINPPKFQMLHCLENTQPGDISVFSDGLRAAYDLYYNYPKHYATLSTHQVCFGDESPGQLRWHIRNVVEADGITRGCPTRIVWSPPSELPLQPLDYYTWNLKNPEASALYKASSQIFEDSLHNAQSTIEMVLEPGDCIIFDNFRLVHARRQPHAISRVGNRRVMGTYVSTTAVSQAYAELYHQGVMGYDVPDVHYSQPTAAEQSCQDDARSARRLFGLEQENAVDGAESGGRSWLARKLTSWWA